MEYSLNSNIFFKPCCLFLHLTVPPPPSLRSLSSQFQLLRRVRLRLLAVTLFLSLPYVLVSLFYCGGVFIAI